MIPLQRIEYLSWCLFADTDGWRVVSLYPFQLFLILTAHLVFLVSILEANDPFRPYRTRR
jgi:hypothetical protein